MIRDLLSQFAQRTYTVGHLQNTEKRKTHSVRSQPLCSCSLWIGKRRRRQNICKIWRQNRVQKSVPFGARRPDRGQSGTAQAAEAMATPNDRNRDKIPNHQRAGHFWSWFVMIARRGVKEGTKLPIDERIRPGPVEADQEEKSIGDRISGI